MLSARMYRASVSAARRSGARWGSQGVEGLERAYDAGITWYDVAPSYGDGMAEPILGQFVSGKRGSVYICTKVGMRPRDTSAVMRILKPMARAALAVFPGIQPRLSAMKSKPFKVPLSAELIRTSIEDSLRRLRTDYVDVLALHRPTRDEVVREDIIRAVERIVQDGKARAISIAGNNEGGIDDLHESLPYRLIQIANNPLEPNLQRSTEIARRRTFVTYGSFSSVAPLVARLGSEKEILNGLYEMGYRATSPRSPLPSSWIMRWQRTRQEFRCFRCFGRSISRSICAGQRKSRRFISSIASSPSSRTGCGEPNDWSCACWCSDQVRSLWA
ncbi:aldo/keto reductase [Bradyrhizobium japonicum]